MEYNTLHLHYIPVKSFFLLLQRHMRCLVEVIVEFSVTLKIYNGSHGGALCSTDILLYSQYSGMLNVLELPTVILSCSYQL